MLCMYVWTYVCAYVCIYIYVYIYENSKNTKVQNTSCSLMFSKIFMFQNCWKCVELSTNWGLFVHICRSDLRVAEMLYFLTNSKKNEQKIFFKNVMTTCITVSKGTQLFSNKCSPLSLAYTNTTFFVQ